MSAPRCGTCRWWVAPEHDGPGGEWRVVNLSPRDEDLEPVVGRDLRLCRSPRLRFHEAPEDGGAAVMDASEYWAALITTAQFGCVNHEAEI